MSRAPQNFRSVRVQHCAKRGVLIQTVHLVLQRLILRLESVHLALDHEVHQAAIVGVLIVDDVPSNIPNGGFDVTGVRRHLVLDITDDGQRAGEVRGDGLCLIERGYGAKNHARLFLPGRGLDGSLSLSAGLVTAAQPSAIIHGPWRIQRLTVVRVETILFHVVCSFRFFRFPSYTKFLF
jgi:hypothetical protein